jgi:FtsH-binding integral membrane protein
MSQWNRGPLGQQFGAFGLNNAEAAGSPAVAAFFNAVYGWMAAGLGLTALVAFLVSHNLDAMHALFNGPTIFGIFIAQLVLVVVLGRAISSINANVATVLFLLYSALNGLTLSVIFLVYAQVTIISASVVTAGMFGAMSAIGMFTQRDLTQLGSLLIMALIGLILASIVNVFFASSGLYWLITYAGVLIFVGLTAYDTQRLKILAIQSASDGALAARLSIVGALRLYLDFLNLFLMLLRILGNRRR